MRSYIFTESERRRLRRWLENGEEDDTTRMLFVGVRRNLNALTGDLTLMSMVARELSRRGRFAGRSTLPRGLSSTLRRAVSALTLRPRGLST
ncbi:MAG TPA: hypothetical protein VM050_06870 [Patescibacteria group bacterium]|nr:hypothetical protein [Patescibacteria group bacterium]